MRPIIASKLFDIPLYKDDAGWFTLIEGVRCPLAVHDHKERGRTVSLLPLKVEYPDSFHSVSYFVGWSHATNGVCVHKVPFRNSQPQRRFLLEEFAKKFA